MTGWPDHLRARRADEADVLVAADVAARAVSTMTLGRWLVPHRRHRVPILTRVAKVLIRHALRAGHVDLLVTTHDSAPMTALRSHQQHLRYVTRTAPHLQPAVQLPPELARVVRSAQATGRAVPRDLARLVNLLDRRREVVVAVALWQHLRQDSFGPWVDLDQFLGSAGRYGPRFAAWSKASDMTRLLGKRCHVLQILAVHPDHRRHRHAYRLLEHHHGQLNEKGLDAYAVPPASTQHVLTRHGYTPMAWPQPLSTGPPPAAGWLTELTGMGTETTAPSDLVLQPLWRPAQTPLIDLTDAANSSLRRPD